MAMRFIQLGIDMCLPNSTRMHVCEGVSCRNNGSNENMHVGFKPYGCRHEMRHGTKYPSPVPLEAELVPTSAYYLLPAL